MVKTLVEAYSEYISKLANDLKYAGQPLVEETDEETYHVIHKKSRMPGTVSSRAGQNIAGVTIKDKYHDRKEAEKHARHLDKHGSSDGYEVSTWINGKLQEETDGEPNQREHLKKMRDDHFAKVDAARDHWNKHVNPSFKKHGLSPKFADAVNKHVALHGDEEVIKNHGQYGSHPDWFDRKTQKVKKLKPVYVVDKSVGGAINPDF